MNAITTFIIHFSRNMTLKRKAPIITSTPKTKKIKKSKEDTSKLDDLIFRMADSLEKTENEIKERKDAEKNDFYAMIGRRAAKLSTSTQQWMEDEVWSLYRKAQRMDNAPSAEEPSTSQENKSPSNSSHAERNVFSFLHNSVHFP